jgi:hypothetical protein
VPGASSGPMPLSRRAEVLRPAHSPWSAPANSPNAPHATPVTTPPLRMPPPAAPEMALHATPKAPQLTMSLLAHAAGPNLGSVT